MPCPPSDQRRWSCINSIRDYLAVEVTQPLASHIIGLRKKNISDVSQANNRNKLEGSLRDYQHISSLLRKKCSSILEEENTIELEARSL